MSRSSVLSCDKAHRSTDFHIGTWSALALSLFHMCPQVEVLADALTKALSASKWWRASSKLTRGL